MSRSMFTGLAATAIALALGMSPAAAQISDNRIKIGVLTDMSGPFRDLAGPNSTAATRMAVQDFGNKLGNVQIEVVQADHQNRADVGATIAREWFDRDGVDVIIDVANSAVALAVSQIARERNKVLLATGPATDALTGAQTCSPNTVHYVYDTWALANGTARAVVESGGKSWFIITADYAFGHSLEAAAMRVVRETGGDVRGTVRVPLNTPDFSSFLLQAQSSRAQIVGLANAGADTINSVKQAAEFGLGRRGQKLASLLVFLSDIHSLGLQTAQGLQFTEAFYWDLNDSTRAWSRRFGEQASPRGTMPSMVHAGNYSVVTQYLNAVQATGTDGGLAVVNKMKEAPYNDPLFGNGQIRADGRRVHDMYLFEAKAPNESRGPWDYYKLVRTIPGEQAFRPLSHPDNCAATRG